MSELPEGWEATTIGDVVSDFETTDPRKEPEKKFNYIDIGSIDNQTQTITEAKAFVGSQAPSRARRIVETGDVLFSTVRTYLRNIAQVPEQMHHYLTSTGIAVLRPSEVVEPGYLFKWVNHSAFVDAISVSQTGALYPAVKDAQVKEGAIPLPPLAEQRRIVAKLDQLSARTRAAKDNLAHVQTLATRAKHATLAAAFRGELTADWRSHSEAKASASTELKTVRLARATHRKLSKRKRVKELPEVSLPEGWCWISPDELASDRDYAIGIGPFGSNLVKADYRERGIRLVFVRDVRAEGFGSEGAKYVEPEKARELSQHIVQPGDVLITKMGDPPGDATIFPEDNEPAVITSDCIKLAPDPRLASSAYTLIAIRSPLFQRQIEKITAGVAQQKVSLDRFRQIAVPLAPKAEQAEIVRRIEAAFARIDSMVSEATRAAELLERLEAQLLAKAFRGELVRQDPADEPASALLARIREARASATKPKRRTKPAKKEANDAFKRSVLATYIADAQCDYSTFGRVKFQKLLHLCEAHLEIQEVAGNYYRDAAGPFDTQMMRSVHSQIKKSGWITMTKREGGKGWTYHRGDKIEGYKNYFGHYFGDRKEAIDDLLALIGPMKTEQAEIVSTAFAAWNDLLLEGKAPSDDEIVHLILNEWTESKRKITPERWHTALGWMRQKGLIPRGLGEHTKRKD